LNQDARLLLPEGGIPFNYEHLNDDWTVSKNVLRRKISKKATQLGGKSFIQLSEKHSQDILATNALIDLPEDGHCQAVNLLKGARQHVFCFRHSAGRHQKSIPFWSRPVMVSALQEGDQYVMIPPSDVLDENEHYDWPSLLRLNISSRGLGLGLVTIESAMCDPPYVIENRTPFDLCYKQSGWEGMPTHSVAGFSAVGYAEEFSMVDPCYVSIQLFHPSFQGYSQVRHIL